MTVPDPATLLLLALVAVVGGIASFLLVRRHRRRAGAWQGGWARWAAQPSSDPLPAADDADDTGGFQPTRVMSYAEAVREGCFEQPAEASAEAADATAGPGAAGRAAGAAAGLPASAERPLLRVKLTAGDGLPPRFATMRVLQLDASGGERTMLVRVDGADGVERIPVGRVEAAIDVAGRARIEDPWRWLRERLGGEAVRETAASPAIFGEGGDRSDGRSRSDAAGWPSGRATLPFRPDRDAIDTATQPA